MLLVLIKKNTFEHIQLVKAISAHKKKHTFGHIFDIYNNDVPNFSLATAHFFHSNNNSFKSATADMRYFEMNKFFTS